MRASCSFLAVFSLAGLAPASLFNPFEIADGEILLGSRVEAAFDVRSENTFRDLSSSTSLSKVLPRDEPSLRYAYSLAEGGGELVLDPFEAYLQAHLHEEVEINEPGLGDASAAAVVGVTIDFTLVERSRLTLTSLYDSETTPGTNSAFNATVVIMDRNGEFLEDVVRRQLSGSDDQAFTLITKELAPGEYRLGLSASVAARSLINEDLDHIVDFSTKVTAEAVPEPGTLAILGLGALLCSRRAKLNGKN